MGALKLLFLYFFCCSCSKFLKIEDLNEEFYVFSSDKWPESWSEVPSIGNGHVALVIKYRWMYMSGLFNGQFTGSQRAKIPSTSRVSVKSGPQVQLDTLYKLDTRVGTFTEQIRMDGLEITLQWFAHRTVLPVIVFQVTISRSSNEVSDIVKLDVTRRMTSRDIILEEHKSDIENARFYHGRTVTPEHPELSDCQQFYLLHDIIPDQLELKASENSKTWTFLTSVHYSMDTVFKGYRHARELEEQSKLVSTHHERWLQLWESGRIELQGNLAYSQAAASSLYNILSSIPLQNSNNHLDDRDGYSTLFTGLSPSGLSWGGILMYQGHTFWDAETWMFPSILMLHNDLAPTLLHSRVRTMDVASRNAKESNLKGLRYPWESALTGIETAPDEVCGIQEIHINGDISQAIIQYWRSSPTWRTKHPGFINLYCPILVGIGDFWLSRAEFNDAKQLYEIKCVMPPDEYAKCVSNSAYTNSIASLSLNAAHMASEMIGNGKESVYKEAAGKIYVPYDEDEDYHPEFDGYVLGTRIKQADVVLLGYPLMVDMTPATRKHDLEIYENVTSPKGPAMSDSMHAVGWLEVGEEIKAHQSFLKMFQHIVGNFQVWTEGKGGTGAPNFITGMGGYLQSLLFGYGGLRLHDDKLQINPFVMADAASISWFGIDYKDCSFDMTAQRNGGMTLTMKSSKEGVRASFETAKTGTKVALKEGVPLVIETTLGYLRVET